MNEFWALLLGSALAVLGGGLGTLFTNWITVKNEKRKDRKEAYLKILEFCNRAILLNFSKKYSEFISDLSQMITLIDLYATKELHRDFYRLLDIVTKDVKEKNVDPEKIKPVINNIIAVVKSDLNIRQKKENK